MRVINRTEPPIAIEGGGVDFRMDRTGRPQRRMGASAGRRRLRPGLAVVDGLRCRWPAPEATPGCQPCDQTVNRIPPRVLVSAGAAPVLLSGGWTLAAARQPHGYDAVRDTISALAARGATDRWVMTAALAGLGACHVITATGLRPARGAGRMVLAFGGVATVLVAAFPEPSQGGSEAYTVAASLAFTSLAIWPAFAVRRVPGAPLLTPTACVAATAVLLGLMTWFAVELRGGQTGSAERAAAGAQALWPLAVVLSTRRGPRPQPLGRT